MGSETAECVSRQHIGTVVFKDLASCLHSMFISLLQYLLAYVTNVLN